MPKRCGHLTGKQLVSPEAMQAKIRAAVASRVDPDFVILARTDARSVEGFDAAIDRAKRYMDAGADGIFAEALESREEFAEFARRLPVPLLANMTEFGRSPSLSVSELGAMGYCMVLCFCNGISGGNGRSAADLAGFGKVWGTIAVDC